jgi:hypothetical protein
MKNTQFVDAKEAKAIYQFMDDVHLNGRNAYDWLTNTVINSYW